MNTQTLNLVRETIARTFGVREDDANLRMGELPQWDSLGHMTLVAELESKFGIQFPGYEIGGLSDPVAIAAALERLGK